MPIRDWPEAERPREKLLGRGAGALSDAELLALFLRTGSKGKSAVDLARELLTRHGGLRPLLEAEIPELCANPGLGPAKAILLKAALELGQRYLHAAVRRGDVFSGVDDTRRFLSARLRHHPYEVFAALFLDNRHRLIVYEELFRGTVDGASVHPREIVRCCLRHNAAAVVFAHNHPSGVAEPSSADRKITERLKQALALIDVRVLDHFVVGDGEPVSFADRGLL
jgi:DNA repair protein RadC